MPLQVSLLLVSQLRRAVRVAGPLDPRLVPPAQCEGWLEGQPTRSQVPQCPRAHEELSLLMWRSLHRRAAPTTWKAQEFLGDSRTDT